MDDFSDKCIWFMELILLSFISLSLVFSSLSTYLSLKSNYLPRQYYKNWNMTYLTDVIPIISDTCPIGYEIKVIGTWSGFNGGCYCSNEFTQIQIATEEECNDELTDIFECYPLFKTLPVDLIKYKGFQFCTKRSNKNFFDLSYSINEIIVEPNEKNLEKMKSYSEYIKILLGPAPPNYLETSAIIDLKLLNKTLFNLTSVNKNYFDLSKYEEVKITNDYSLYILRLNSLDRKINILDLQKIIVDIHLYNELWCSYLDISSIYLKSKFAKDDVNYGDIKYCESFYFGENSTMSFNDNFINSERMNFNFDYTVTSLDFYNYNGIKSFYDKIKTKNPSNNPNVIKNSLYGNFEPIMIAQKYYWGVGCLYSKLPAEHIEVLAINEKLTDISGSIAFLSFICVILFFFFICAKINSSLSCKKFLISIIFILSLVSLLGSFTIGLLARQSILYLKDFMIYCQTDYTNKYDNNALKTTEMENKYFEGLNYTYQLSGSLTFFLFFTNIFLVFYLIRIYKKDYGNVNNDIVLKNVGNNSGMDRKEIEINVIDKGSDLNNYSYNNPNYGNEKDVNSNFDGFSGRNKNDLSEIRDKKTYN